MIPDEFWKRFKNVQRIHQRLYDSGRGWIVGRLILLLRHTGRRSGKQYATPLQYEQIEGAYYIGAARGTNADWFRNIQANPRVQVQIRGKIYAGTAEAVTDTGRVADFLRLRLKRHPFMIGVVMHLEGLPFRYTRKDLERFSAQKAMVVIKPDLESA